MLDELLKEINELKEYKKLYEYAIKDKKLMSERLYKYMMKEYESMTKEERIAYYKKECCNCCRYNFCGYDFPDDICKPIPSEIDFIPARVICKGFKWS